MIHDIEMPEITEIFLFSVVELQITLLEYAASDSAISYTGCKNYLSQDDSPFKDQSQRIAPALWGVAGASQKADKDRSSSELNRIKFLKAFSEAFHRSDDDRPEYNDPSFKKNWLKRIRQETEILANPTAEKIEIGYFYGDGYNYIKNKVTGKERSEVQVAPVWQQKAGEFFLDFYKAYLEDSKDGFLASFFPFEIDTVLPGRKHFGRQELLELFREKNKDLHICPVCDENGYYTESRGAIRATLDHFLPKDLYPHFACHPHNLVPTCYGCNSNVKGSRDPLHKTPSEAGPGFLWREALPYARTRWKRHIYLAVDLSRGLKEIRLNNLQYNTQLKEINEERLHSAFEILERVYDIPGRWATGKRRQNDQESEDNLLEANELSVKREPEQGNASAETQKPGFAADRVSETLFRRMRHFLGQGKDIVPGDHMLDELYNALCFLLYYLSEEDRYKDPLTIPMLWILAALLAQESHLRLLIADLQEKRVLPRDHQFIPPGLDEILSWCGQDSTEIRQREDTIQTILNLVRNRSDH